MMSPSLRWRMAGSAAWKILKVPVVLMARTRSKSSGERSLKARLGTLVPAQLTRMSGSRSWLLSQAKRS
ncbi:MAG: hypothetical protein RI897_1514 [Verrucomicrobiota bacterium]